MLSWRHNLWFIFVVPFFSWMYCSALLYKDMISFWLSRETLKSHKRLLMSETDHLFHNTNTRLHSIINYSMCDCSLLKEKLKLSVPHRCFSVNTRLFFNFSAPICLRGVGNNKNICNWSQPTRSKLESFFFYPLFS